MGKAGSPRTRDLPALGERLVELATAAEAVWTSYRSLGPGRVDPSLHGPVEEVAAAVTALLADDVGTPGETDAALQGAVDELLDLSHRCACTSLGLCFVSGEAGMIPRPDLHRAFDAALDTVRAGQAGL